MAMREDAYGNQPRGNASTPPEGKSGGECGPAPGHDPLPSIKLHTADELRAMNLPEVISHTVRLQQLYKQAGDDIKIIAWEFKEFQEHFLHFSRAAKLAHKLGVSDVDAVAELAVSEVPRYFHCRFAALFFFDAEAGRLELDRCASPKGAPSPQAVNDAGPFLIKLFSHQSEPFIIESKGDGIFEADTEGELSDRIPAEWGNVFGNKAMALPLHAKQVENGDPLFLGGLIIGDSEYGLEAKDAEVATIFGDLLSSSLYNAKLVQCLNALTIIDPLTNIFNRRHLMDQLTSGMAQARRHGHSLSVAMLDIDHFKRVNDSHGHLVGDKVLRELADLLKGTIRAEADIPARYGGEEFMIVMPYINLDNAVAAAERIRGVITRHSFAGGEPRLEITVSIGVAEYAAGESLERFIDRADLALYDAKKKGRNRTAAAPAGSGRPHE